MRRDPRVAILARDLVWADESGGSLAFSYAARKLEASLRSAPDLAGVEVRVIDLRTGDEEAFFEEIRAFRPTLVAASAYVWSVHMFCRLAAMVEAWDPTVAFVLGGPAARPSLLRLAPYAPLTRHLDAVVTGEGEEMIRRIARAHTEPEWLREVPGLEVPGLLGWRSTGAVERPVLDDYPSPYQLGGVPRGGIGYIETFRGCPISCAFCQWGVERADRVHSAGYLATHLTGLTAAGVESVYVLDAGFNLSARAFRNLVAAEREVGVLRTLQVLGHIYPTLIREEHLELFETFRRAEITVGVQSIEPEVLKRLGRPFDVPRFERVLRELRGRFDLDLEIILGLPGDDPASFRRTFERAIELGDSVRVFYCLALPDALLERAEELDITFDPLTFEVRSCAGWTTESLRSEWEHVRRVAETMERPSHGPNWTDFRTRKGSAPAPLEPSARSMAPEVVERLRRSVDVTASGWRLSGVRTEGDQVLLDLEGAAGTLVLEAARASEGTLRFREQDGIAYSHRGSLARAEAPRLHELIERVHGEVRPLVLAATEEGP